MKTVVLLSCVRKKRNYRTKAEDLYISPWFNLALRYAKSLDPEKILILSAKHGVLDLEQEVDPYELSLRQLSNIDKRFWAERVLEALNTYSSVATTRYIIIAGEAYRKYLIPHLGNVDIPLKGLGIGKQLQKMKQMLG